MKCQTVTLRALQDIMMFCPNQAHEAATLAIRYPKEPAAVQTEAKKLMKTVILSGDVGTIPPERLRDLAIWVNMPDTVVVEQNRPCIFVRSNPGDRLLIQELADAYTEGNVSKLIVSTLRQIAGVDI